MAEDVRDYVAKLYQQELGRTGSADEILKSDPGLQYWVDEVNAGRMSRDALANAIGSSAEGIRYDIGSTYQSQLGRSGDVNAIEAADPEMKYWTDAVQSGRMSLAEAQNAIARSQEGATYDVNRVYKDLLKRSPDEPGAEYWKNQLISGQLTEDQFVNAVKQSEEYRNLNKPKTVVPTPAPVTPAPADRYEQLRADAMARYETQIKELQNQALKNAAQGTFVPTAPLAQAGAADTTATQTPTAGLPTAAQVPAPTPAPGQFVPQTYLAPPPPQYRGFSPFEGPYQSPFQSYYDIAMRGQPAPQQGYSYMPQPYQAPAAPNQLPTVAMTTPNPLVR